jgi:hypothetical protein
LAPIVELMPDGDGLGGKKHDFNTSSSDNAPRVHFSATLGEEPEVEVTLG